MCTEDGRFWKSAIASKGFFSFQVNTGGSMGGMNAGRRGGRIMESGNSAYPADVVPLGTKMELFLLWFTFQIISFLKL